MEHATDQHEQQASLCWNMVLGSLLKCSIDINTECACSVSEVSCGDRIISPFGARTNFPVSAIPGAIPGAIGLHNASC